MDEQAIRQWAWEELKRTKPLVNGDPVTGIHDLMYIADNLAAWVMSGKMPEGEGMPHE